MSKERLEEIAYNVGISIDGESALMSSDDYDFLYNYAIEQVERVQELEEIIEVDGSAFNSLENMYIDLEKQNKRYRERIEYMLEEAKDHKRKGLRIQHWALIKDLEETLEGEE